MRCLHLAVIAGLLPAPNAHAFAGPVADMTPATYADGVSMRERCARIIQTEANAGDSRTEANYIPATVVFAHVPGSWPIQRGGNFESAILVEFRATAMPSATPMVYRAGCYFRGGDFDEMSVDSGSPAPSGPYGQERPW
jgi:hypothetical protein